MKRILKIRGRIVALIVGAFFIAVGLIGAGVGVGIAVAAASSSDSKVVNACRNNVTNVVTIPAQACPTGTTSLKWGGAQTAVLAYTTEYDNDYMLSPVVDAQRSRNISDYKQVHDSGYGNIICVDTPFVVKYISDESAWVHSVIASTYAENEVHTVCGSNYDFFIQPKSGDVISVFVSE